MTLGKISPNILNRYEPEWRTWLSTTKMGWDLYFKLLNQKGGHTIIYGQPGSGKTRKMIWFLKWLKELETVVWVDSCKDEEIGPLFGMGKHINIIIPFGMKIQIKGLGDNWSVREAYMPDQIWDLIEPDAINILSIRAYFFKPKEYQLYLSKLFQSLIIRAMEEWFRDVKKIERMSIFNDEAQEIVPSTTYTHEAEAIFTSQLITSQILYIRAYGIRFVLCTQDSKGIYPLARRNIPTRVLCHGSFIDSMESRKLHKLGEFTENYRVDQGLVVYSDGTYFPRDNPWPFPDYPKPKGARIRYIGKVDRPTAQDEIEQESMPDLGRYHDQAQQQEKVDLPLPCGRYDTELVQSG